MDDSTAESGQTDFFDDLLNLEDKYHTEGYDLGAADGARAGRIEGRTFGLEKGFEKFAELGRLGGRADVWNSRLKLATHGGDAGDRKAVAEGLRGSERLKRQVERLRELTDPESLSTMNDEESVNEFDERLREAKAKATLISKMAAEKDLDIDAVSSTDGDATSASKAKGKATGEMEDFAGVPAVRKKE